MKKRIWIIVLIAVIAVLMACGGGGSPSSVVRKALSAVEKGDTKGIEETFTYDGAAIVVAMMEKAQGSMSEKGGIAKTEETIDGDFATVKVTFKDGSTDTYELVKQDGKWKITMGK